MFMVHDARTLMAALPPKKAGRKPNRVNLSTKSNICLDKPSNIVYNSQ